MKNRIFVVEDEDAIRDLILMNLQAEGYETVSCGDGKEAEGILKREGNFDLVLLDLMLPGMDGFSLLEICREKEIPAICVTARSDVGSRVYGLKSGAEDYMVKPFEVLELMVRIEKVLERTKRHVESIFLDHLQIDLTGRRVWSNGQEVSLKPMEYDLLVFLAKHRNVAISREQLLDEIWGINFEGESRTVDVHIGQLRKKLDLTGYIVTVPKVGYRLQSTC